LCQSIGGDEHAYRKDRLGDKKSGMHDGGDSASLNRVIVEQAGISLGRLGSTVERNILAL
jgi:hypothetical protein